MTTETMTVHKGLCELKILDKRISTEISEAEFCICAKASAKKIKGMTPDEYKKNSESGYNRICDLIRRRDAIKQAISRSNASTNVTINDEEYTVAEAIYMNQSGVVLKQELLRTMKSRYNQVVSEVERSNVQVGMKADDFARDYATGKPEKGNKPDVDSDDINSIHNDYYERNKFDIVTGIDMLAEIKKLESWIDSFKAEVDSALSVSNAITTITVTY